MQLTRSEAASHILRSHGLSTKRHEDPLSAMQALIAVQTQYPASLGPALAARSDGATATWIEGALTKDRVLLKAWNLRSTLHTAMAEDHLLMLSALRVPFLKRFYGWMLAMGFDRDACEAQHIAIFNALSDRPMGRKELHAAVPVYKSLPMVGWGLDVKGLAYEGKLVLASQAASNTEFVRLDLWAPHLKPCQLDEAEAVKELARRYFRSYGPATFSDFLAWSGLGASRTRGPFTDVKSELVEVSVEDKQGVHYMSSTETVLSESPLRLLPKFDPLMMGHKDRSLFLPEKLRTMVFRPAGQVEAVVLAGGLVRGTWRTARKGKRLEFLVYPFETFKKSWVSALPKEAHRAAVSLGFVEESIAIL